MQKMLVRFIVVVALLTCAIYVPILCAPTVAYSDGGAE
jgi:hypothetical protein